MKNILLSGVVLMSLTACGAVQQMQLQSKVKETQQLVAEKCGLYMYVSPKEASAWYAYLDRVDEQCYSGMSEPWERDEVISILECSEPIMKSSIRPVAYSKSKFDKLLKDRQQEYQDYADGSLSWDAFNESGIQRFGQYLEQSKTNSYFSYAQCHNAIVQENVFPVYPAPFRPILTEYLANVSSFSRKADKTNMDREDFTVGAQQLWADFAMKEQQQINAFNAQNQQAWQNMSQQLLQLDQQQKAQCGSIDIPPMASLGCKNVCINGAWAEVCG